MKRKFLIIGLLLFLWLILVAESDDGEAYGCCGLIIVLMICAFVVYFLEKRREKEKEKEEKEEEERRRREEEEREREEKEKQERERQEEEERERLRQQIYEQKKQYIMNSDLYKYIEMFVVKYRKTGYTPHLIGKLRELLYYKGMVFTYDELLKLINEEIVRQNYKEFRRKMLSAAPESLEDYVDIYLQIMGENYRNEEYLYYFWGLLSENGIDVVDHNKLLYIVEDIKTRIELEKFEKHLSSFDVGSTALFNQIDTMSGYEFEMFLKKVFENLGYKVEQTQLSRDQGGDLIISKFGEKIVVQVKRHSRKVTNKAIQEVVAAVGYYKADRGIVIATSGFTKSAVQLAEANNVELIDRLKLMELIKKAFGG